MKKVADDRFFFLHAKFVIPREMLSYEHVIWKFFPHDKKLLKSRMCKMCVFLWLLYKTMDFHLDFSTSPHCTLLLSLPPHSPPVSQ